MDGWMDGWMDGRTDGWKGGWVAGVVGACTTHSQIIFKYLIIRVSKAFLTIFCLLDWYSFFLYVRMNSQLRDIKM